MGIARMAGGKASNKPSLPRADFEEIEAAVMETARGRWFLAEYARRHRTADTSAVLEALARLETKLTASLERARFQPATAASAPALDPEPARETPPPAPPPARADDLKAMAEELLRGSRLFDWVGTDEPETQDEVGAEPWSPEPEPETPLPAPVEARAEKKPEPGDEQQEDEAGIDDADMVEWEAELAQQSAPFLPAREATPPPHSMSRPPPAAPPIARSMPPPFTQNPRPPLARSAPVPDVPPRPLGALSELPEVAPRPIERQRSFERQGDQRPPLAARSSFGEPKPIPSGPRTDDPTLTMTRDEKLALFS